VFFGAQKIFCNARLAENGILKSWHGECSIYTTEKGENHEKITIKKL